MQKKTAPTDPTGSTTPARRTGRKTDGRLSILRAAERLFAERGFEGCSLRNIADLAKVNQGMIHYFFRTKESLFLEAYMQCGRPLVEERNRLLDAELAASKGEAIQLERLIEIFLRPSLEVASTGSSGRSFFRMQAHLQLDNSKFGRQLRSSLYDESSRRFVEAFARSLPNLTKEQVHWRFVFTLGVYQYTLADTGRLEAISEGESSGRDYAEALRQMIPFIAAGMRSS